MTDRIVVTGGAGFLAQHLIKELQHVPGIIEILAADKKIYRKFLDYDENVPVIERVIDCSSESELNTVLTNCSVVFNLSARNFTFDMYQPKEKMMEDNYHAVKRLVSSMQENNVELLIHVSDALVCLGSDDAQAPTERGTSDAPSGGNFLLGAYAESKFKAEQYLREANGLLLKNGNTLKTVILRPCVLYGEGDSGLVSYALRICQQYNGLTRIGAGDSCMQFMYAGNAAQMLVLLWQKLRESPADIGGEVFFGNENKRPVNFYAYIDPFITNCGGYKLSAYSVPYLLALPFTTIFSWFFRFLFLFNLTFPHNMPDGAMVRLAGAWYTHFNTTKALLMLGYKPKYNPDAAMERTIAWWKDNWRNYV